MADQGNLPPPPPDGGGAPVFAPPQGPYAGAPVAVDQFGRALPLGWKRFFAAVIDGVTIFVITFVAGFIYGFVGAVSEGATGSTAYGPFGSWQLVAISWGITFLYFWLPNATERGQSLGKLIMGIRLRDAKTGGRVGYGKAALRALLILVMIAACYLPAILSALFPLWDQRRETLDDKATRTYCIDASVA